MAIVQEGTEEHTFVLALAFSERKKETQTQIALPVSLWCSNTESVSFIGISLITCCIALKVRVILEKLILRIYLPGTLSHLKSFIETAVPPIRLFLMIIMMPLKMCVAK